MNWIKKHLKWIILGLTIFFAIIIFFTDCPKLHAALALITPVLLSFLSNNEKLTAMRIAKMEKEEREQEENEKFEKMLNLVKKIVRDICEKAEFDKDITFTEDEMILLTKDNLNKKEEIIRNIILIKLPVKKSIFAYFMEFKGKIENFAFCETDDSDYPCLLIKRDKYIFLSKDDDLKKNNDDLEKHESFGIVDKVDFYVFNSQRNIDEIKFDKQDLEKLKQELPKILTPDVFDGEKLIV